MKKKIALLVSVFLMSTQSFSGEGRILVKKQQSYEGLCDANQRPREDGIVDFQPGEELGKQEKCCAPANECANSCRKKYFDVTWAVCSLFFTTKMSLEFL